LRPASARFGNFNLQPAWGHRPASFAAPQSPPGLLPPLSKYGFVSWCLHANHVRHRILVAATALKNGMANRAPSGPCLHRPLGEDVANDQVALAATGFFQRVRHRPQKDAVGAYHTTPSQRSFASGLLRKLRSMANGIKNSLMVRLT
jgi:hypothetical protein